MDFFGFVQPFESQEIALNAHCTKSEIPISSNLGKLNMVIEASALEGNSLKCTRTYFSATIKIRIFASLGQLKVYRVT